MRLFFVPVAMSRPSLEFRQEQERLLETTNALKTHFELSSSKLRLVQNSLELRKLDSEESGLDFEDTENRDPAVIAANLVAQTVCMYVHRCLITSLILLASNF